jgi:hypothetical protein
LKFLTGTIHCELSILATNVLVVARGLRKSSSLTNGMSPGTNKTALREYGTEARGLHLSYDFVHAPILGTPVNGPLRPKGEDIEAYLNIQLR